MKKAVITGSTCSIGIALSRQLADKGYEVISVVRPNGSRNALLRELCPQSNLVECSLDKLDELVGVMDKAGFSEGADEFYHLGWTTSADVSRNDPEGQVRNRIYTENALRAASALGCRRFVGIGSQAECGKVESPINSHTPDNPLTDYARTKCSTYLSCCELSDKLGIEFCWPRILSEYGPYDRGTLLMLCIDACRDHKGLDMTAGTQIWDYVYSDDVARAIYLIMQKGTPKKKYSIASGNGRPLHEYIKIVSEVFEYPELMDGVGKRPYTGNEIMYLVGDVSELRDDVGMVFDTDFRKNMETIKKTIG